MAPRLAPAVVLVATLLGAGCASSRQGIRKPPYPMPTLPAQATPQVSQAPAGAPFRPVPQDRPVMPTGSLMGRSDAPPVARATPAVSGAAKSHKPPYRTGRECGPEG